MIENCGVPFLRGIPRCKSIPGHSLVSYSFDPTPQLIFFRHQKGVDMSAGVQTWSHEYGTDPAAGNGNACLDQIVRISCFGHGLLAEAGGMLSQ
jgi:hypothetical protein